MENGANVCRLTRKERILFMKIIHLDEIDSTNSYLRHYPDDGAEDMVVATADFQTAGRGQGSHTWESEPGKNLLFSVLIHPVGVAAAEQFILSEVGALALKTVLDDYAEGITLKWPNDVYWHDRKLSGTLIETAVSAAGLHRCVYGVGLNVNQRQFHGDAPNPVSLWQILGRETDRGHLLHQIATALEQGLQRLYGGERQSIRQAYHQSLYRRSGYHPYSDAAGRFMAAIDHVADDGHLILTDTDGRSRSYAFGEVKCLLT